MRGLILRNVEKRDVLAGGRGWDSFRKSAVIAALQLETCPQWRTPSGLPDSEQLDSLV